ncbi:MAG: HAMP domain-containing protein [Gemmatimonadetes bacterium]|nr:MAG: HAMP domain-containing protein [Gemmatimonadota bacterium]
MPKSKAYQVNQRSWFSNQGFQFRFLWIPIVPVLLLTIGLTLVSFYVWTVLNSYIEEWSTYANELQQALVIVQEVAVRDTASVESRAKTVQRKVDVLRLVKAMPEFEIDFLLTINLIFGLVVLVVVLVVAVWIALIQSHRIAGPIDRFNRMMKEIGTGKLYWRMRFRQKDELKTMIESDFNSMLDGITAKIEPVQSVAAEIVLQTEHLKPDDPEALEALWSAVKRLENQLNQFECTRPSQDKPETS